MSNQPSYWTETCDAARDAIAFALAVHRDDTEAIAAIFNNSDPFDLAHMLARYFTDFIKVMAAGADDRVTGVLTQLQQAQQKGAAL